MNSLLKLFGLMKPYWKIAMLGPVLMTLEVAMDLLQPRLMQRIVDVGIAQFDLSIVFGTGGLMIVLSFIGVFAGVGGGLFAVRSSQLFAADLRSALFRKVQSLSFGNLDKIGTGELITRLTNDVTQVQEAVFLCLHLMVRAPLIVMGSMIMAILTSPKLALMLFVLGPIIVGVLYLVIKSTYRTFVNVQKRVDALNSVMLENLAGVRVVKAFVRTAYENNRFGRRNTMLKDDMVSALRVAAITMPLTMFLVNIGIVGVIWIGGIQVNAGVMKVGEIIAFVNYLLYALSSIMMVGMLLTRVSRAAASAERLVALFGDVPEVHDQKGALESFLQKGKVVFDCVAFRYNGDESGSVLKDISFTAEPGQMVAILGATGAGKSSLIHLIPRFYDASDGSITIDGVDVRNISQKALRKTIGIAMQDVLLFSGTIRENLAYGRTDATFQEIVEAAQSAQAHEFISALPDGYETQLGQRGVNLSGGQKQRLAIARALVTKPAILILDDSTSAVDVETESKLQEALRVLMKDKTSFVIAQRISTVLNADKIIVLDDGKVVAEGTHKELLSSSQIYHEIYESQLGNGVVSYG
jgi:ATP-binding cassette subfamily B protein